MDNRKRNFNRFYFIARTVSLSQEKENIVKNAKAHRDSKLVSFNTKIQSVAHQKHTLCALYLHEEEKYDNFF